MNPTKTTNKASTPSTRAQDAQPQPQRCRLLQRAQMHGAVREPGYVFTLAPGERGPHKTVLASNAGAQIVDHINQAGGLKDVPLYEVIGDEA